MNTITSDRPRTLTPAGELAFIAVLFCASGMTSLIYETLWFAYSARVFGNSTYAIGTVVAVFMAGLALGSKWCGPYADRARNGLRLYAYLECGVLAGALLVPVLLAAVRPLTSMTAAASAANALPVILRLLVLLCILLPPTICMGATLPALTRHAAVLHANASRGFSLLYGVNTLGAVAGCVVAGFLLLPCYGERACLAWAVLVNAGVVVGAFVCAKALPDRTAQTPDFPPAAACRTTDHKDEPWMLYVSLVCAGAASMCCEVAWMRVMALVIGGSVYAFTTLLAVFLTALGAGALLATWLLGIYRARIAWLIAIELATAALLVLTVPWYDQLAFLVGVLNRALLGHFNQIALLAFGVCLIIVLVPGMLIGMAIPVAVAAVRQRTGIGAHSGAIYAANTVGNICGAFSASFILIPLVGTQHTLLAAAWINIAAVVLLARYAAVPRARRMALWAGCAVIALVGLRTAAWEPLHMTAGMFMYGTDLLRGGHTVLYNKDGVACTVAVTEYAGARHLRINGKIDASNKGDMLTQLMVAHLPMLLNPGAQRVFVLGLGSGVTLGGVCRYNVARVDCAEIEARVVEAMQFFDDVNHEPLKDPRVQLFLDDGRNILRHARQPYDVIISEPSNPWIAGIADLFTYEWFRECRNALATNGVMCQWLHTYNLPASDYAMIARTFASVFPYHAVYEVMAGDTILIGSQAPVTPDFARMQRLIDTNALLAADLRQHCGGTDACGIFARYFVLDLAGYDRMCQAAPRILRERHNTLEYSAARALYSEVNTGAAIGLGLYQNKASALPNHAAMPVRDDAEYVAALVATSDKLMRAGNVQGALYLIAPLAAIATNNVALQVALVRAAVLCNDHRSASNTLHRLIATAPVAANDMTCWLVDQGKFDLARYAAAALHALYPESIVAMVNLSIVNANLGQLDRARDLLRAVLAKDPMNVQAIEQYRQLSPGAPPPAPGMR
jgi:spermidine synthase